MNKKLIELLSDGRFHSGSEIGCQLRVSRAAIWKQVKKLSDVGLVVHAVPGKGYQIPGGVDLLNSEEIGAGLPVDVLTDMAVLDVVDTPVRRALLALNQSGGRGIYGCVAECRMLEEMKYGRAVHSNFAAAIDLALAAVLPLEGEADVVTLLLAAAMMKVLGVLGAVEGVQVRWPADLMAFGRRLGGVELEIGSSEKECLKVSLGVRLWVRSSPYLRANDVSGVAASLQDVWGVKMVRRNALVSRFVCEMLDLFSMNSRQLYALLNDRLVKLVAGGGGMKGSVRGIDGVGRLCLETEYGVASVAKGELLIVE